MRYDSYTRLINGKHPLPEEYVPKQLTDIGLPFQASSQDSRRLLEIRTAQAALRLFQSAQRDGLNLYGISGYRSYQCQKQLYGQNPYVAAPGTSEHQSGLALDVSCAEAGFALTEEFAFTSEGSWLSRNASLFGFIIRYPKGKRKHYWFSLGTLAHPLRYPGTFQLPGLPVKRLKNTMPFVPSDPTAPSAFPENRAAV